MRAPVSFVIPTLNACAELAATLAALAEGLDLGLIRELIISDGGSSDDISAIADAAGAVLVTGPPGRGGQLGRGADTAQGDWLLFLHADTHLGPGWARAVLEHIVGHPDKAAYFRLAFRNAGRSGRIVAGWANWRARALGLPYGDQALLIRRDLYDRIGGYPAIPLMEDVAIVRALKGRLRPLATEASTSAARYQSQGWLRCGARNLITLARYLAGTDPRKLASAYIKR